MEIIILRRTLKQLWHFHCWIFLEKFMQSKVKINCCFVLIRWFKNMFGVFEFFKQLSLLFKPLTLLQYLPSSCFIDDLLMPFVVSCFVKPWFFWLIVFMEGYGLFLFHCFLQFLVWCVFGAIRTYNKSIIFQFCFVTAKQSKPWIGLLQKNSQQVDWGQTF